jgi:nucleotide-binding universal stress UspA family protein
MATLFRRILVPHDFSSPSRHALKVAIDLAAEHAGRVHVVHAVTPYYLAPDSSPSPGAFMEPQPLIDAARKTLAKEVAKVVGRRRVKVRPEVLLGEPVQVILDSARGADSIVMATMGRTGLERLLIGSVAERVVRHSPVPVLSVRGGRGKRR